MNAPPDEITLPPEDGLGKGPGERLAEAREAAGLSAEEVSARLHLDRRTIELLEADDFAELPAPTFVRGYLRSYSRMLDLPPGPIIEAFDRRGFAPPALIADIATQAETRSTDFWVASVSVFIIALLAVLATVWYQAQRTDDFEIVEQISGAGSLGTIGSASTLGSGSGAATGTDSEQEARQASTSGLGTGALDRSSEASSSAQGSFTSGGASDDSSGVATTTSEDAAPAGGTTDATQLPSTSTVTTSDAGAPDATSSTGTIVTSIAAEGTSVTDAVTRSIAGSLSDSRPATQSEAGSNTATADRSDTLAGAGETTSDAPLTVASTSSDTNSPPDAGASAGSTGNIRATSDAGAATPPVTGPIDTVSIRFSREAWVEMYDANEKKLYYNLAKPGRTVKVSGVRPIRILLGYVKGVQIEYNGAPFDFSPHVSKGVARFQFRP